MIRVECKCGGRFRARDEHAEKRAKCPACGEVIVVPPIKAANPEDSARKQELCRSCQAILQPGAVLCIKCGYHKGKRGKIKRITSETAPQNPHISTSLKRNAQKNYALTASSDLLLFEELPNPVKAVLVPMVLGLIGPLMAICVSWSSSNLDLSSGEFWLTSCLVILFFACVALYARILFVNKTTLTVTRNELKVRHSIVLLPTVTIQREQLTQIYVRDVSTSFEGNHHPRFDVMAITPGGKRKKLLNFDSKSEAFWIEETIEDFLDIVDELPPRPVSKAWEPGLERSSSILL